MRAVTVILLLIAALGAGYAGSRLHQPTTTAVTTQETTYDRVMRTGTLRCGYFIRPPFLSKDPNGAFSGISYDMITALARETELKTEWIGEMSFGTYLQDLAQGRFDAECGDGWPNALRDKYAFYSKPYAYVPIVPVVRINDNRFDSDPQSLNNSAVTIVTMDGETSTMVARTRLPNAKQLTLPQNAASTDLILNVTDGKGDVTLADTFTAYAYIKANPGKVKMVKYAEPLHLIGLSSTLPQDPKLKNMFDVATDQLIANGTIEAILKKYEPEPGIIWRTNKPFSGE